MDEHSNVPRSHHMTAKFAVLLPLALLAVLASASNESCANPTDRIAELHQADATAQDDSEQQAQQNWGQQRCGNTQILAILKDYGMTFLLGAIIVLVLRITGPRRLPALLQVRLPAQLHTTLQNGSTTLFNCRTRQGHSM